MLGAVTLQHGLLTLPLSIWIAKSNLLGILLWLAVSLFVAAGVGWAVVVDTEGFVFCRTWLGIPLRRRRLPRHVPREWKRISAPLTVPTSAASSASALETDLRSVFARTRID